MDSLKKLKVFQNIVNVVRTETRQKVNKIKSQLPDISPVFNSDGNEPATGGLFGVNDSFQKKSTSGPGVTPTQLTKSAKDNTSRSFDDVPSFYNAAQAKNANQKDNSHVVSKQDDCTFKPLDRNDKHLSFDDKPADKNILDDSFGAKGNQSFGNNVLDDSFGAKNDEGDRVVENKVLDDSFGRKEETPHAELQIHQVPPPHHHHKEGSGPAIAVTIQQHMVFGFTQVAQEPQASQPHARETEDAFNQQVPITDEGRLS